MKYQIKAYVLGALEFKDQFTTNMGAYNDYYDKGRAFMHRLTGGKYDPS